MILAQKSADDTFTDSIIYTVPAGKSHLIQKIWAFRNSNGEYTFMLGIRPASYGAGVNPTRSVICRCWPEVSYSGNGGIELQTPFTLSAGDSLTMLSGWAGGSVDNMTVFGQESSDATQYGVLSQVDLTTSQQNCYTVPTGKKLAVSTIVLYNGDAFAAHRVYLAFAPGGAVDNYRQHVIHNYRMDDTECLHFGGGVTLEAGDVIRAWADASGQVGFGLYGVLQ